MSKVRVAVLGTVGRAVTIDSTATNGAQIGTNLFMPDGTVATVASLASLLGVPATGSGVIDHRLLRGLALGDDHPQYVRKDTLTTRGDLYARGAATVGRLGLGTVGQLLRSNGTDPVWATLSPVITLATDLSGAVTLTDLASGTLAATIVNNAVTDAKLRDSVGTSVIGRSAGTTGDPADIVASADTHVLRRASGVLGFGQITSAYVAGFSEAAQDAVGGILTDTAEINFTYDDTGGTITADLIAASVTFSKIQNIATSRFVGRVTASSGSMEALTGTQATALLDPFTSTLKGLVPASGGGTANFLRADGTWVSVAEDAQDAVGSILTDTAEIDFTYNDATPSISASLVAASVAFSKIQNISTSRFVGRVTAGTGSAEALTGTQATTLLDVFTSTLKGLTPASGGGTTNFLRADGNWAAPSAGSGTVTSVAVGAGITASPSPITTTGTLSVDQSFAPVWTGTHTYSVATRFADGSESAPAITFTNDLDTGFYRGGSDILDLVCGGVVRFRVDATRVRPVGSIHADDGSEAVPVYSFTNDLDTGMYRGGSNILDLVCGGVIRFRVDSTRVRPVGAIHADDGSASVPIYSFTSDTDTGMYRVAENAIGFAVGGAEVGRFDTNSTAGQTRFALWDVDNGTLERVSVGAADSGGAGFKVLRIPN